MNDEWNWWAGTDEEWFTVGPCNTKEQAIEEMLDDGVGEWLDESQNPPAEMNSFYICEARNDPLRIADWIDLDWLLEKADENLGNSDRVGSENDEGPWFEVKPEQEKDLIDRIRSVCDAWQKDNGLVFTCRTFSNQRNFENLCLPAKDR